MTYYIDMNTTDHNETETAAMATTTSPSTQDILEQIGQANLDRLGARNILHAADGLHLDVTIQHAKIRTIHIQYVGDYTRTAPGCDPVVTYDTCYLTFYRGAGLRAAVDSCVAGVTCERLVSVIDDTISRPAKR